ncbi:MAG TPA: hypothetical protein VF792_00125 [Ktedonobacterales bacterium]
MPHDVFDVYETVIKDTNSLNDRRRQLDSLYVTLIIFILTGDAYLAFYSVFNNWLLVAVTVGISLVGGAVTTRWREGLSNIVKILDHRYDYLRTLEQTDDLKALGASVYSEEWKKIYKPRNDKRFRSVTNRLQLTFIVVFILIPCVLAALTAIETIPAIHGLIPLAVLQYIRPIVPITRP